MEVALLGLSLYVLGLGLGYIRLLVSFLMAYLTEFLIQSDAFSTII